MSDRKRINISVSPKEYAVLEQLKHKHGFNNLCEMIKATMSVLLNRESKDTDRTINIPNDDWAYINQMFNEFANTEITPDGNPPKRHPTKRIDK